MRGKRSFYFLFFALAPLLLTLQAPERTIYLHQISLTLSKPFLQTSRALSLAVRKTGDSIGRFWNLYQNQVQLTERVSELEQKQVQMLELEKENDRLRKLLDFKKTLPSKTVAARVIGWDLVPWRKTILIDKGSRQGVKKRMAVVNSEGLVGRVIEAGPFSSRVILLIDPESRVSAVLEESRDLAVAEGDGSSRLRVTHIDRESPVKVGNLVLSSGLGGIYPKGILIGKVEMVGTEKESLELFGLARPFVNFSKLEEVLCIVSSPEGS